MSIYLHKVKSRWQPGENTVAYYPLETDTNDYSGNSHNGTNYGTTFTTLSSGKEVGVFDGSAYIQIPDAQDMRGGNQWTMGVYLKKSSGGNVALDPFSKGVDRSYSSILFRIGLRSDIINNIGYGIAPSNSTNRPNYTWATALDGNWHHLIWTFDNGIYKLYGDGNLLQTQDFSSNSYSFSSTGDSYISGSRNPYESQVTYKRVGNLSEMIIENKARTEEEVEDYYMLTKGDYHTETQWEPNENTVAYYPLKEDILDHSGNNKDFTGSGYTFANNMITITSQLTGPVVTPENTTGDRTINMRTSNSNTSFYSFRGSNNGPDGYLRPIDSENGNRPGAGFKTSSWYRNRPSASDLPTMGDVILMTWIKTGDTMKLYINGVLTSTTTLNTSTRSSSYGITKTYLDPGTYGEIIVEDKVWSADEVLSYYYQTRNDYVDDPWYPVKEYEVQNIYIGEYGWKPNENTLLYLPLESDVVDQSGKSGRTFTTSGLSYTTVGGIQSLNVASTGGIKLTAPYGLQSDLTKPITVSMLLYKTSISGKILDMAATNSLRQYFSRYTSFV